MQTPNGQTFTKTYLLEHAILKCIAKETVEKITTKVPKDVRAHLVVYIIRAQPPNDHTNKRGTNGNPLEIALWVIRRSFGSRLIGVACAAQEFADVIQVGVS